MIGGPEIIFYFFSFAYMIVYKGKGIKLMDERKNWEEEIEIPSTGILL